MTSVCTEQQHQLFYSKKSLLDLNIPPRKLLGRRNGGLTIHLPDLCFPSAFGSGKKAVEEENLEVVESPGAGEKGYGSGGPGSEVDKYSSDEFRMFEFKIRRCMRGRTHDWTDCPFAHPGEKARRRDPRRYHYSGNVCDKFKENGNCPRGDACELAHGVFELWLHPSRYRTTPCKDGRHCTRKVCFFAHSPSQLRVVPNAASARSPPRSDPKPVASAALPFLAAAKAVVSSPTSTLYWPISPAGDQPTLYGPISPVGDEPPGRSINNNVNGFSGAGGSTEEDDDYEEVMTCLKEWDIWGPPVVGDAARRLSSRGFNGDRIYPATCINSTAIFAMEMKDLGVERSGGVGSSGVGGYGPDLEWVNELLM